MTKPIIPTYDICSLNAANGKPEHVLIERFSTYLAAHQHLKVAHRHSFYHMVLFTKGCGKHAIDFVSFPVEPNQIYFMIPGQVHSWQFEGEIDGYIINFSDMFFQSFLLRPDYLERFTFFSGFTADEVISIPESAINEVKRLFEALLAETDTTGALTMDMIRSLLLQLFVQISRADNKDNSGKTAPHQHLVLRNFHKLIEEHYATMKLPKDYAALLYITPNHLNALCKDILGRPAGEVIRDRVILEAKRLLINAGLSITEIAWQLNFPDNSYFTKFFKKYTKVTPDLFRKEFISQTS